MNKIFVPPSFADQRKTYTARLQYVIIWWIFIASSLTTFLSIALPETALRWLIASATGYISSLIFFELNRRGHVKLVSWCLLALTWGVATALAITAGGMHASAVTIYLITALTAGVLFGEIIGLITVGLCILTQLALVYAENAGILPRSTVQHTALSLWVTNTAYMVAVIGLQYLTVKTVMKSYERVDRELQERQKAELELDKYRKHLEELVADRTNELTRANEKLIIEISALSY